MPTATIYPATVACVARGTGSSPLDPNVAYPIPVTISSLLTTAVVTVVGAPQYQVPPSYAYNGTAKVAVKSIGVGFIPKYASNTKATVTIVAKIGIDPYIVRGADQLIQWSKIGSVDFTIDKSNEAGNRPFPYPGLIFGIVKHGASVIVYGQNGIGVMKPSGVVWGFMEILPIGLIAKNAHSDGLRKQVFITSDGVLYEYTDQLKRLDYSKWLSVLGDKTVISYDDSLNIHYICDGTYGFVYSDQEGLTVGPTNISGLNTQRGVLVVSPDSLITTPPMYCQTDIYDFGSRKEKTISQIRFGTAVTGTVKLKAMIEYRYGSNEKWYTTPWVTADRYGVASIFAKGIDFRFNWQLTAWQYIELPYIVVYAPDEVAA